DAELDGPRHCALAIPRRAAHHDAAHVAAPEGQRGNFEPGPAQRPIFHRGLHGWLSVHTARARPHSIPSLRGGAGELLDLGGRPFELGFVAGERALELVGPYRAAIAGERFLDDADGAGALALVPVGPGHLVPGLRELVRAHLRAALVDEPPAHRDGLVEPAGRGQELAQVLDQTLGRIAHHAVGAVVGTPAMAEV